MIQAAPYFPVETLPFILTAIVIEITPGPNMTWLAVVSALEGRRAGFAAVAGIALGLSIIGLAGALGASTLIQSSWMLYEALRWAGVLFLLYLAADGWLAAGRPQQADKSSYGGYFLRGLVTNIFNPKALLFYIAVLPGFVSPQHPVMPQTLVLTAAYVSVATLIHALITLMAGTLEPMLNDPRRERLARRALSALLALVAIWFAFSTAQ
ncbi:MULTISPECIES: LysE family translocator [unclassified Rhizobium]|uniref:LysE family translocator n=1 Tax=unclassified Rhizobium TaxID=2613769 RepID=UPI000714BD98|nr:MULTISPECIES: LysE family translocator [unclassified Rhizobium]KQS96477.1 lysine transporter LysE [Rhizobium sp. Leaf386]KQT06316.1 lysine transporter LysE [Rhizobium sp. Leaf391]KQU09448.1 lysine transporter LysE [Rhizobium sp. Leaf453]